MTPFLVGVVLALALVALAGAVKIVFKIESTVTETLPAANVPFGQSGSTNVVHSGLNVSKTFEAGSAAGENVTQVIQGQIAMVAGAVTLNLAAAPSTIGVVDLTGLKLRTLHVRAKADNANPITIAKGAANGYTGLGAAFSCTLDPGKEAAFMPNATAVAAGVRTLDITGTGAQVLEFIATAGNN